MNCSINCDLGEGLENDKLIMPYIDLCNIACGGHAGNEDIIQKTIQLAQQFKVQVGAHPSYPDRLNFGRVTVKLDLNSLADSLIQQIQLVEQIASTNNVKMKHIKFHGALYNDAARDIKLAQFLCELVSDNWPHIDLLVPPKTTFFNFNTAVKRISEGFIDRLYDDNLNLAARNTPGALIEDVEKAYHQFNNLNRLEIVETHSGKTERLAVKTLCIHGDNPNALAILKRINQNRKKYEP